MFALLTNSEGDPDTQYLSDGISESLINSLSELPKLRVIPRTTAFTYKGKDKDPREVGRDLNVRAVLTGRLVKRADTLTVQIDLIDVSAGSQLWGGHYTRKFADILAVQDEFARQVVERLRLELSPEDEQRLTKRHTENTQAYELYLKGRYFAYKMTKDGMDQGIGYFNQAIQLDPRYALAYAGLADAFMTSSDWYMPSREAGRKAKEAALMAVRLDEALSEAHYSLAHVVGWYDWDWSYSEQEFKRAIGLNPGSARAHDRYGFMLAMLGRADESLAELKRAQELDLQSAVINTDLGTGYYFQRRYEEAIEQLRKTVSLDPNFWLARVSLASAYTQHGMIDEAVAVWKIPGLPDDGGLGFTLALSGKRVEALKILEALKHKSPPTGPWGMAFMYTGLGDKDQAITWLEKARDDRFPILASIKVDPGFDSLRKEARFIELLRTVHLAP